MLYLCKWLEDQLLKLVFQCFVRNTRVGVGCFPYGWYQSWDTNHQISGNSGEKSRRIAAVTFTILEEKASPKLTFVGK